MTEADKQELKELEEKVGKMQCRMKELRNKEIEEQKAECAKYVGRCFKNGNTYFMIVSVPAVDYTITSVHFNPYQLPCMVVKDYHTATPFATDTLFYRHLPEHYDPKHDNWDCYTEITQEEFFQKMESAYNKFKELLASLDTSRCQEYFQKMLRLREW